MSFTSNFVFPIIEPYKIPIKHVEAIITPNHEKGMKLHLAIYFKGKSKIEQTKNISLGKANTMKVIINHPKQ